MARKTIAQLEERVRNRDEDITALKSQLLETSRLCDQMNAKIRSLENDLQEAGSTIVMLEMILRSQTAAHEAVMASVEELLEGAPLRVTTSRTQVT